VPPSIADAASPNTNQRSANETRIDEGLKSLAAELSCLKGFSEECAETRKDVFDEFQLTETDKVYTKKYAHTGMPAEFYGMSERQIRKKLNLKFAGENGIVIIPDAISTKRGLRRMKPGAMPKRIVNDTRHTLPARSWLL